MAEEGTGNQRDRDLLSTCLANYVKPMINSSQVANIKHWTHVGLILNRSRTRLEECV